MSPERFHRCALVAAVLLAPAGLHADVTINEFMVHNPGRPNDPDALLDMDGKSPDWVELYNSGDEEVDLTGWALSDNPDRPDKWVFAGPEPPSTARTTIPPKGYRIVFCGGIPRNVAGVEPHTTFGLDNSGAILLSRPDGAGGWTVVHSVGSKDAPYPSQRQAVSYGFPNDDSSAAPVFFENDTPGASNAGSEGVPGFCADPDFSVDRGIYESPFQVTVTCATPGATLAWTVDGTLPGPGTGTQVPPPGPDAPPSFTIPIEGTTILRVRAHKEGLGRSLVKTKTYIFPASVLSQSGPLPSMNLGPDDTYEWGKSGGNLRSPAGPDWEVDPDIVNHPNEANRFVADDLKRLPVVSLVTAWREAFGPRVPAGTPVEQRGFYVGPEVGVLEESTDRYASLELINPAADPGDPNGGKGFQVDGNVHVFGGTSQNRWKSYKLSMRFKAESKVSTTFYGPGASKDQDMFILDARLSQVWVHPDSTQRQRGDYVRDHVMNDLQLQAGWPSSHSRPVHLFLNGLYWGMYIVHERPNDTFAAAYMGGDDRDWDIFKHSGSNGTDGAQLVENVVSSGVIDPSKRLGDPSDSRFRNATVLKNWEDLLDLIGIGRVAPNPTPDLTVRENYEAVAAKLDIPAFCDYILLNAVAANSDWPHKNLYATYRRGRPDAKWRFHSWDAEHVFRTPTENTFTQSNWSGDTRGPGAIHRKLAVSAEYRLAFADTIHRRLFNNGVYSTANLKATFERRFAEIEPWGIRGESARWGDNRRNSPYTYTGDWLAEKDRILNTILPARGSLAPTPSTTTLNQCRNFRVGATLYPLYPATAAPEFRNAADNSVQHGGAVPAGFTLRIANPGGAGTVYYTLDGSDPRTPFEGTPSPTAAVFGEDIPLTGSVTVNSRVLNGTDWSALNSARFSVNVVPASAANLVVSEFHYHPADPSAEEKAAGFGETDFEYVELMNISDSTVVLDGVAFTAGLTFEWKDVALNEIPPGGRILVVENERAMKFRYGEDLPIAGEFALDSSLSNSGERLRIVDAAGNVIKEFEYSDDDPWPTGADGGGYSLVLIDPASNPDHSLPSSWRLSALSNGGTPGGAEDEEPPPPPAPYAGWKEAHGITDDHADGDGDGFSAVLEYAFDTDPKSADSRPFILAEVLPQEVDGTTANYLCLTIVRRASEDLVIVPEFSGDLNAWTVAEPGQRVTATPDSEGRVTEVWRDSVKADGNGIRHARVRVTVQ